MQLKTLLLAAVATVALAAPSMAAPITDGSQLNIGGFVRGDGGQIATTNSLDFTTGGGATPGTPGNLETANGTGSFAGIACVGNCGTINDIPDITTYTGTVYTLTSGLTFALTSPASVTRIAATPGTLSTLILNGTGTLVGGGFDLTSAIFTLTAQGNNVTTFSASTIGTVPVPEPVSAALFGMGLLGLGLVRARRKAA